MAQSFTFSKPLSDPLVTSSSPRRNVLITGAAGRIGSHLAANLADRYELRLMVRDEGERQSIAKLGPATICDLTDLPGLKAVCRDIDTVIHLAAEPNPNAVWSKLLPANIVGVYNLMAAAKSAGCRRVIYASSIHAVSGHPRNRQLRPSDPVNPGDLYGVTKCFGEALGRYMAEQEGLSVIALRIGAWVPAEKINERAIEFLDGWTSPRDLQQLVEKCIETDRLQWAVFNAISNVVFQRMDMSDARELLGYQPADDLTRLLPPLAQLNLDQVLMQHTLSSEKFESGLRDDL